MKSDGTREFSVQLSATSDPNSGKFPLLFENSLHQYKNLESLQRIFEFARNTNKRVGVTGILLQKDGKYHFGGKIEYDVLKNPKSHILPVYPGSLTIFNSQTQEILYNTMKRVVISDDLTPSILKNHKIYDLFHAYQSIHSPVDEKQIYSAIKRLRIEGHLLLKTYMHYINTWKDLQSSFEQLGNESFSLVMNGPKLTKYVSENANLQNHQIILSQFTDKFSSAARTKITLDGSSPLINDLTIASILMSLDSNKDVFWVCKDPIAAKQSFETLKSQLPGMVVLEMQNVIVGNTKRVYVVTRHLLKYVKDLSHVGLMIVERETNATLPHRAQWCDLGVQNMLFLSKIGIPERVQSILYGDFEFLALPQEIKNNCQISVVPPYRKGAMTKFIKSELYQQKQVCILSNQKDGLEYIENCKKDKEFTGYNIDYDFDFTKATSQIENFLQRKTDLLFLSDPISIINSKLNNIDVLVVDNTFNSFDLLVLNKLKNSVNADGQMLIMVGEESSKTNYSLCTIVDERKLSDVQLLADSDPIISRAEQQFLNSFLPMNKWRDVQKIQEIADQILAELLATNQDFFKNSNLRKKMMLNPNFYYSTLSNKQVQEEASQ